MKCLLDAARNALETGNNAFLLHSNADLDCVGSAAALALLYNNGANIIAPGGVSHLGKRLLSVLNLRAEPELDPGGADRFFVLDAQDDSSLRYPGTPWDRAFVIDHHRRKTVLKAACEIVDEGASSCCEIVWDIIGRPDRIDRSIGLCLMAGIVADTGHLKRGTHRTLASAAEILEASGLTMEEVMEVFGAAEDQDISRRVSRLKGVQRMRFDRVGEWAVAVTEIGSFESAVCHALLSVGADIAFAGSQKDHEFRITGRGGSSATSAGIHLGTMFGDIATQCSCQGGGHDGAAGLSGKGDAEAMLDICMRNALTALKGKSRNCNVSEENVL